jgi:hypothetical protein
MAQDKRTRYLRRLKRQNTLLHRQTQVQQGQMQQLAQMVMENQKNWNDLKAVVEAGVLPDPVDENDRQAIIAAGGVPVHATDLTITRVEDENADRADDSATA